MGNKGSKIDDISQLEGDMKHMAIQASADCVRHRHMWKQDFGFEGELKIVS